MPNDTDYTREAQKIWQALRPMVTAEIERVTGSAVRARKMTVTVAPSDGVVGVAAPFDQTVTIPYSGKLDLSVGDSVWVYWYADNASTMIAMALGEGQLGDADIQEVKQEMEEKDYIADAANTNLKLGLQWTNTALDTTSWLAAWSNENGDPIWRTVCPISPRNALRVLIGGSAVPISEVGPISDFNSLTDPGLFYLTSGYVSQNVPYTGFTDGTVLVLVVNSVIYQILLSPAAAIYCRQKTGNTWSAWQKLLATPDLANNLTTTAAGLALDARQGKALSDKIDGKIVYGMFTAGTVTTGSGNYVQITVPDALPSGAKIISAFARSWSSTTGAFAIHPYGYQQMYLVANAGTTVTNLVVGYAYIV